MISSLLLRINHDHNNSKIANDIADNRGNNLDIQGHVFCGSEDGSLTAFDLRSERFLL
jgi:hypothetical protein